MKATTDDSVASSSLLSLAEGDMSGNEAININVS